MRNIWHFILRYSNFLLFLALEVVAFLLIIHNNDYQHSAALSSANCMTASINQQVAAVQDYFSLRATNEELTQQNAELQDEIMHLKNKLEYRKENDPTYKYSQLDYKFIPAKVVAATLGKQHNYLTINKGIRDDIQENMGVICHDGVVGVIKTVSEQFAIVVPVIHTKMNISARLPQDYSVCSIHWPGKSSRYAELEDVGRHCIVSVGDTIRTSGLSNIFPENIIIGIIDKADLTENDSYYHISLRLSVDFPSLTYVHVLSNGTRAELDSIQNAVD